MAGWRGVPQAVLWKAGLISVSSVLGDSSEAQDRETSKRFSGDGFKFPALFPGWPRLQKEFWPFQVAHIPQHVLRVLRESRADFTRSIPRRLG